MKILVAGWLLLQIIALPFEIIALKWIARLPRPAFWRVYLVLALSKFLQVGYSAVHIPTRLTLNPWFNRGTLVFLIAIPAIVATMALRKQHVRGKSLVLSVFVCLIGHPLLFDGLWSFLFLKGGIPAQH